MSSVTERYVRCPNCRYPNLAQAALCTQCDAALEQDFADDLHSAASETIDEVRRIAICAGMGLMAGALIALVAVALTRGLWLQLIADTVLPRRMGRGNWTGWALVSAVPLFWAVVAPRVMKSTLGGSVEVFADEEVHVGTWASGVFSALLIGIALSVSDLRALIQDTADPFSQLSRTAPFLFWMVLPWICQVAAVIAAVGMHRRLELQEL